MSSVKKITLESSDGRSFEVDEAVATEFHFKRLIKYDGTGNRILLPKVRSRTLAKVIEYCKKHAESANPDDEELKAWDAEFVRLDQAMLFDLINAANDMKIKGLVDLIAEAVAALIRGKNADQMREILNITGPKLRREVAESPEFRRKVEECWVKLKKEKEKEKEMSARLPRV